MTYSCTDFTDTILDALEIELEPDEYDNPGAQADLAVAEIERLQRFYKGVTHAVAVLNDTFNEQRFLNRIALLCKQARHEQA